MMYNKVMFGSCLPFCVGKIVSIIPGGAGFGLKPELFEHFLGVLDSLKSCKPRRMPVWEFSEALHLTCCKRILQSYEILTSRVQK